MSEGICHSCGYAGEHTTNCPLGLKQRVAKLEAENAKLRAVVESILPLVAEWKNQPKFDDDVYRKRAAVVEAVTKLEETGPPSEEECEHYIPNPRERCMICHPEIRALQTHSGDGDGD